MRLTYPYDLPLPTAKSAPIQNVRRCRECSQLGLFAEAPPDAREYVLLDNHHGIDKNQYISGHSCRTFSMRRRGACSHQLSDRRGLLGERG
jgi:hypothetical protein